MIRIAAFGFICLLAGWQDSGWWFLVAAIYGYGLSRQLKTPSSLSVESALRDRIRALEARNDELVLQLRIARDTINALLRASRTQRTPPPRPPRRWLAQLFDLREGDRITADDLARKYRELAKRFHPDTGGTTEQFAELQRQHERAKQAVVG